VVDMLVDSADDLRKDVIVAFFEGKGTPEAVAKFFQNSAVKLQGFETYLRRYKEGKHYLTDDEPTIADFALFDIINRIEQLVLADDKYPLIKGWYARLSARAGVAEFLKGPRAPIPGHHNQEFHLTYFESRGRAEPIKFLFADTKTQYKFTAVKSEEWPALKAEAIKDGRIPFGQLPFLQHGDLAMSQTHSILRYLGRLLGRYPKTDKEQAVVDMLVDSVEDLRKDAFVAFVEEKGTPEAIEKFIKNSAVKIQGFQTFLGRYKEGKHYLTGDEPTIADMTLFDILNRTEKLWAADDKYPLLKAWYARFSAREGIAEFLKGPRAPIK